MTRRTLAEATRRAAALSSACDHCMSGRACAYPPDCPHFIERTRRGMENLDRMALDGGPVQIPRRRALWQEVGQFVGLALGVFVLLAGAGGVTCWIAIVAHVWPW